MRILHLRDRLPWDHQTESTVDVVPLPEPLLARATNDGAERAATTRPPVVRTSDRLVDVLLADNRIDDALALASLVTFSSRHTVVQRLIDTLIGRNRLDDAVSALRSLSDRGDASSAKSLVELLVSHHRVDALVDEVEAGTPFAVDAWLAIRANGSG